MLRHRKPFYTRERYDLPRLLSVYARERQEIRNTFSLAGINAAGFKSIRLDVCAVDADGVVYSVEMQTINNVCIRSYKYTFIPANEKVFRYISVRGYIRAITLANLSVREYRNKCEEIDGLEFRDETTNANAVGDRRLEQLYKMVVALKGNKEKEDVYMNLDGIVADHVAAAEARGIAEGMLLTAVRVLEKMLKRSTDAESYSAFANTKGGYIILGVKKDKKKILPEERFIIQGIQNSKKQVEDFWNTMNSSKVNRNILKDKLPLEDIYRGGNSKSRNPHMQTMLRMVCICGVRISLHIGNLERGRLGATRTNRRYCS